VRRRLALATILKADRFRLRFWWAGDSMSSSLKVTGARAVNVTIHAILWRFAYAAQGAWLAMFDLNLLDAFEINPMAVFVRSTCFF
jgi:hypothetical protein